MRKFDRDPLDAPIDELLVTVKEGVSTRRTAQVIEPLLQRLHGGADDYEVVVPEALLEQSRQTQRIFNIVMGSIAGISLLVGGIGIMNIMLASVLERTREIGVRRAIGATRRDIRSQFVIESFSISLLGGMAGIIIGIVLARIVGAYAGWPTVITYWSLLLSTGVSISVGLVSGIYPAARAAENTGRGRSRSSRGSRFSPRMTPAVPSPSASTGRSPRRSSSVSTPASPGPSRAPKTRKISQLAAHFATPD
jgi:putative ABC transport system permease protein